MYCTKTETKDVDSFDTNEAVKWDIVEYTYIYRIYHNDFIQIFQENKVFKPEIVFSCKICDDRYSLIIRCKVRRVQIEIDMKETNLSMDVDIIKYREVLKNDMNNAFRVSKIMKL